MTDNRKRNHVMMKRRHDVHVESSDFLNRHSFKEQIPFFLFHDFHCRMTQFGKFLILAKVESPEIRVDRGKFSGD